MRTLAEFFVDEVRMYALKNAGLGCAESENGIT